MPLVLPPVGEPIPDTDSPMDARPQVRANIIDANPALDIPGCKWVRASEVTVTRYAEDCKITCGGGLACVGTGLGKSVIRVTGEIRAPGECDVVSVKINGVSVPFRKFRTGTPLRWYYQTYDEHLYTGEFLFPLCEYQLIEVTTRCGDICQFRLHSCGTCYNAYLTRYPAVSITRSYTWTRPGLGGASCVLTETLDLPEIVFSSVWESQCLRTFSGPVDVNNAYTFELEVNYTLPPPGSLSYEYIKIYNAGVRVSEGYVARRGNCTIDHIQTYVPGSIFPNVSVSGSSRCWAFGAQLGAGPGTSCPTAVGPGKRWLSSLPLTGPVPPIDVCGGTSVYTGEVYASGAFHAKTCAPYLDLGDAFGYNRGPSTWACGEIYTYEMTVASV